MPNADQQPAQIFLGKLPKNSDSRTISLPALLTSKRTSRAAVNNGSSIATWGELGNDVLSDCTCAAAGHAEMVWAHLFGTQPTPPTQNQIIDAYSKITGYTPGDPSSDKGADLLSVLKYWQKTGIAGQKIGAYAEIPTYDIDTLKWTIDRLGVAYVGIQLPAAWLAARRAAGVAGEAASPVQSFSTRRKWYSPATWQNPFNGHCVIYDGYDDTGFRCVSWGTTMTVSVEFHHAYCDEAYAIIPPEVADGTKSIEGLGEERLLAAFKNAKKADPIPAAVS